ncbi:MAG: hypothetical protein RIR96_356 [Bacteroidota bacterium]
MEAQKLLQASFLDILFDRRNKLYGAYQLRKEYPIVLLRSIFIVFLSVSILFLLISGKGNAEKLKTFEIRETAMAEVRKVKKEKQEIAHKKKQHAVPNNRKPIHLMGSAIVIIDSTEIVKDSSVLNIENGNPFLGNGSLNDGNGGGGGGGADDSTGMTNFSDGGGETNEIFDEPEIRPTFPGGMNALNRFLQENLEYPDEVKDVEMATVVVRFVVGYDGVLRNFEIVTDGGIEFDREVIRVIKKMPSWIPGKSKGKNVSVYYNLPVHFVKEQ